MKKIKGIIDRIEGEIAVIRSEQKDVLMPVNFLEEPAEGKAVVVWTMGSNEDTQKAEEIAQNLLKEILEEE
jgi:hypothetical protein